MCLVVTARFFREIGSANNWAWGELHEYALFASPTISFRLYRCCRLLASAIHVEILLRGFQRLEWQNLGCHKKCVEGLEEQFGIGTVSSMNRQFLECGVIDFC